MISEQFLHEEGSLGPAEYHALATKSSVETCVMLLRSPCLLCWVNFRLRKIQNSCRRIPTNRRFVKNGPNMM